MVVGVSCLNETSGDRTERSGRGKTSVIVVWSVAGAEHLLAGGDWPKYMAPAAALASSAPRQFPAPNASERQRFYVVKMTYLN